MCAIADASPEFSPTAEPPRCKTGGTEPDPEAELVAKYGEPIFYRGENGAIASINERFFAGRSFPTGWPQFSFVSGPAGG